MNKRWQKLIRSLHNKKFRKKENLFLVEGAKNILELIKSDLEIEGLFYTEEFQEEQHTVLEQLSCEQEVASDDVLKKVGTFQSNNSGIAVVKTPENAPLNLDNQVVIALDDVRDPGNLGTIIRIADWYGVKQVLCSLNCADWYNPKVINASMGSFTRVKPYYIDLKEYLVGLSDEVMVYGTFMNGINVQQAKVTKPAILIFGNESNGISTEVADLVHVKLTIPRRGMAESLNVSIAAAVVCDNVFRSLT
ncbi:RNA methyltransferase [Rapidithrix thailandica]|uniref:RNA methyltransferase n=1 Tax=Rapidithrix thailandica TaxID=413964 RepID=A0AAW9S428_9BACT